VELTCLADLAFRAAPGEWRLQRCEACSASYLDPRPTAETLHLAYRNYYTHTDATPSAPKNPRQWLNRAIGNSYRNRLYGTRLSPSLPFGGIAAPLFREASGRIRAMGRGLRRPPARDASVLDIGCGNGEFLALALAMGWQAFGVELDATAAMYTRRQGITVLGDRVSALGDEYERHFDAITLSHVIEHMADPVDELGHCLRLLKPGGYLWIETPNIDSIGYRIYGRFWRGLEPPRHLTLFGRESLCNLLARVGFSDVRVLPARDALEDVFTMSQLMEAGLAPDAGRQALSPGRLAELGARISGARSTLQGDPHRSEFLAIACTRPGH
jgi:2-polyprenyl-3-methyl-5-hydroxy-6-metoxy-1,4-benzoquinol methylase